MRKIFPLLITGLLSFTYLQAEFANPMFNGQIAEGYRKDDFAWNISGPHNSPRELLEVDWQGLEILETTGQFNYTSCNNYYIRASGGWGSIRSGSTRIHRNLDRPRDHSSSSSSRSDSHEHTISRIRGANDDGHVWEAQGAVGYQFMSNGRRATITPVVGYSYKKLRLVMAEGRQVFNCGEHPRLHGRIRDLRFSYEPEIQGPFVGVDVLVLVEVPCVLLYGSAEWHWDQYRANGNWRLGDHFNTKFHQRSTGQGMVAYLGFSYKLGCGWYLGVVGYYRNWHGREGRHRTTAFTNRLDNPRQIFGTMPIIPFGCSAKVGSVHWSSWSVALSLDYRIYNF